MKTNLMTRLWRKLDKTISSFFFIDQWVILTAQGADYKSLKWDQFQRIIPPPDRYWADPFVIQRNGQYFVFIEEKIYQTKLGRITCLVLDKDGNLLSNQPVLEKPYHLSYPFLFEYKNELYMLPESATNRRIELYRCINFPHEWVFVKNLMADIYAADTTLLDYAGKWWLFTNVKVKGGSSLDSLYLYSSDSPLSDSWTPHPNNPIVHSFETSRSAGRIFNDNGRLIRPSQDHSRRYGYAINFNEINKLSVTEYKETTIARFAPPRRTNILAAHTWNATSNFQVSDAVLRRRKSK